MNDHDFPSDAKGGALPYGICDLNVNHGYLLIGTTHDTADFAVDNVVRWWNYRGKRGVDPAPVSSAPVSRGGRAACTIVH